MIVMTGLVRAMPHDDFGQPPHTHASDHAGEHEHEPADTDDVGLKHHSEHSSMSEHVFIAAPQPAVPKPDTPEAPLDEAAGGLRDTALVPPTPPPNAS
jgi:hypothetical protein